VRTCSSWWGRSGGRPTGEGWQQWGILL
jgi:hypothetical protein